MGMDSRLANVRQTVHPLAQARHTNGQEHSRPGTRRPGCSAGRVREGASLLVRCP